jgi:glycosyltransferase involved in cell wall biosynthesis
MTRPNVSVLMATYNRAGFIAESLESVVAQTHPPSQIIVINDGSTDNTRAALEPFMQRIEYVESENRGKASALNLGMPRVTGDYVWIMDDDDVAMSDALERHLAILESRSEVGWTYSSFIESTTDRETARIVPQREKILPEFPEEEFLVRLMEQCFLIHPTILVRASCYREVGSFDPNLVRCQDYEMAVRLARRFPCVRISGPTICYRMHGGTRGSARDTFKAGQIQEKWLEYMQTFMRKLREEMPLSEYLPGHPTLDCTISDLRYAYLRRVAIMARKRLYNEMVEDLRSATQVNPTDFSTLTPVERKLLRDLFNSINDPLFFQKDVLLSIRSACRGPAGFAVRGELIRCLYWDIMNSLRGANLARAFGAASAAMYLSGVGVLRSFFRDRNTQPGARDPVLL